MNICSTGNRKLPSEKFDTESSVGHNSSRHKFDVGTSGLVTRLCCLLFSSADKKTLQDIISTQKPNSKLQILISSQQSLLSFHQALTLWTQMLPGWWKSGRSSCHHFSYGRTCEKSEFFVGELEITLRMWLLKWQIQLFCNYKMKLMWIFEYFICVCYQCHSCYELVVDTK